MKQYDYKTISCTMLGDLHTPVSTYLKVRDIFPQSALMESSDYHGSENNRSFIALCPLASVSIDHGTVIFRLPDDSREEHPITDTYRVENALNDFRARFRVEGEYSNYCGLYGYTSFNAVRYFENIPVKDSREATNDAPDMLYILYKYLIVFNDFKNEMLLLEMLAPGETSGLTRYRRPSITVTTPPTISAPSVHHLSAYGRGAQGEYPPGHRPLSARRRFPDSPLPPVRAAFHRR